MNKFLNVQLMCVSNELKIKKQDVLVSVEINHLEGSFIIFKSNVIMKVRNPMEESSGDCQGKSILWIKVFLFFQNMII